jgi:hypothetical protein
MSKIDWYDEKIYVDYTVQRYDESVPMWVVHNTFKDKETAKKCCDDNYKLSDFRIIEYRGAVIYERCVEPKPKEDQMSTDLANNTAHTFYKVQYYDRDFKSWCTNGVYDTKESAEQYCNARTADIEGTFIVDLWRIVETCDTVIRVFGDAPKPTED